MAQCHAKGPVGGTGRTEGKGLSALSKADKIERNKGIALKSRQARERRIALVAALGRLEFQRGTAFVDVPTADLREGLELLVAQQGWTVAYRGDKAIVQKVTRATFMRTASEPRVA